MKKISRGRLAVCTLLVAAVTATSLTHTDWLRETHKMNQNFFELKDTVTTREPESVDTSWLPSLRQLHTFSGNVTLLQSTREHQRERQKPLANSNRDDQQEMVAMREKVASESRGHVLALDYWEQQTSGSRNLQSLQCWAAQYNLSVVEPAMPRSQLRMPLNNHVDIEKLWFRDFYDIDRWNRLSRSLQHSELVSWQSFLHHSPRDVILVTFKHAFPRDIVRNLEQLSRSKQPHRPASDRVTDGCLQKWDTVKQFLYRHHFRVVREICFNFAFGDSLSKEEFEAHLFGSLSPSSCTVVFSQWRGTGPPSRVAIHNSKCKNSRIQERAGPSQGLLHHAQLYQDKYLGAAPYTAVIARMEKVQALLRSKKGEVTLAQCFTQLLRVWRETVRESGVNSTFLAIDMGKFGSNSIHNAGQGTELSFRFNKLFSSLYGGRWSVEEWEDSLEDVVQTEDPGYVAALQQTLVAQAKCAVFIGGGSFQNHAYALYMNTHHKHKCVRVVNKCSYPLK